MISQILKYINNYFVYDNESYNYSIDINSINGNFKNIYLVGMYICIKNSFLNDGVYKILTATSTKLTLDATLIAENTTQVIDVYSLRIPQDLLTIITDITTYNSTSQDGISSKGLGDLSVSYTGDSGWQSVYKNKLTPYTKMYSDFDTLAGGQLWKNKRMLTK